MDQNLTGLVAANLTGLITGNISLSQPLYVLLINALIGPISALIGAGAVYLTSQGSQRHEEYLMVERGRQEKYRILRDERKNAYIKYLCVLDRISNTEDLTDSEAIANAMSQAYNEFVLFASKDILDKADKILQDNKNKELKDQTLILWSGLREYMRAEMQET